MADSKLKRIQEKLNADLKARSEALQSAANPKSLITALESVTSAPARRAIYNKLTGENIPLGFGSDPSTAPTGEQINAAMGVKPEGQLVENNYGTGTLPGAILTALKASGVTDSQAMGLLTELGTDPLNYIGLLPEKMVAQLGNFAGVAGTVKKLESGNAIKTDFGHVLQRPDGHVVYITKAGKGYNVKSGLTSGLIDNVATLKEAKEIATSADLENFKRVTSIPDFVTPYINPELLPYNKKLSGGIGAVDKKGASKTTKAEKVYGLFSREDLPDSVKIGKQHIPEVDIGKEFEYNYRLNNTPDIKYYVKDNKVVGHVGLDDEGSVKALYVDPEYRGSGIAKRMYKDIAKERGQLISDDTFAMEPGAKALWNSLKAEYPEAVSKYDKSKYVLNYGAITDPMKIKHYGGIGAVNPTGLNTVLKADQASQIVNEQTGYAEGGLVKKNEVVNPMINYTELQKSSEPVTETQPASVEDDSGLLMSDAEMAAATEAMQKYGDRFLETAGYAGLGALTAGFSTEAAQKLGLLEEGELAKMDEFNPYAAPIGETAGIVGAALASRGQSLLGMAARGTVGAAEAAGGLAETAVANYLKNTSQKKLAGEVLKKSLAHKMAEKGAMGVAEGATFGIADLANEHAMGKAEFNAENLMNYAASGALGGGLITAAIPAAGAGLGALKRGGKTIFDKSIASIGDPLESALDTLGVSGQLRTKILTQEPMKEFKDDLLPWISKKFSVEDYATGKSALARMEAISTAAQKEADDIIMGVSNDLTMVPDAPGLRNRGRETYKQIVEKIDDAMRQEIKRNPMGARSPVVKELQHLRNASVERYAQGEALSPARYRELRQGFDKLSKFDKDKSDVVMAVAREARDILNTTMHDLVSVVDKTKGDKLKELFKDMRYTATLTKPLQKKVATSGQHVFGKMLDIVQAAGLVQLAGTPGAVLAGGLKFVNSDLARRMQVMQAIRKANVATEKKTTSAITNFLNNHKVAKKAGTISSLMVSKMATPDGKQEPKNRQEAYQNISKNVSELIAEPEKLLDRAAKSTAILSYAAPDTAMAASNKIVNATQFLQSKIPKSPYIESIPGLKRQPYQPSSMELAQFERYLQVIEMPLTVLDELEQGTLTREHVEALQAVYPEMYEYIRSSLINKMQDSSDIEMSYSKRIQVGILLDIASDASMLGHNIAALQANFAVQEHPEGGSSPVVQPTQGGAANITTSKRTASDTQSFAARRAND